MCFIGNFKYKGKEYNISHKYRYYFAHSVEIDEITKDGGEIYLNFQDNKDNKFIKIYLSICYKLEKEGYGIIEYRMDDKEFAEFSDSNNYEYLESGKMF